jgi:hypothetical protein
MQDAARRTLSQYCSLFGGVADGLNLRYYPRCPTGSTESVVVSLIGEDNPRLSSTVNLVVVLNTELDYSLDELSRVKRRLLSCVLSWQSATTRRVVPPLLLGLSTLTARRHVVTTPMVPLPVGPG